MGPDNSIDLQGAALPAVVIEHCKVRLAIRRFTHCAAKVAIVAGSKYDDGNERDELTHVIREF